MMLALSLLLALIPLLGIAWILRYGSITTVDGLFTSLILLAMSGILGVNVLLELKKRTPSGRRQSVAQAKATSSGMVQRGKVEKVELACATLCLRPLGVRFLDRKSTRLNSSHVSISYAVFCL